MPKDILNREIKVGEFVIYFPSARSARPVIGKLLEIIKEGNCDYFKVIGCDENYNWNPETRQKENMGYMKRSRPGNVSGASQILVVDQNLIPDEVKKLYV